MLRVGWDDWTVLGEAAMMSPATPRHHDQRDGILGRDLGKEVLPLFPRQSVNHRISHNWSLTPLQ